MVIASNVTKNVTIEIIGTDMKGPAPLTAKLEKDKAYKARVSAPYYTPKTVEIKGGQDKTTVKIYPKPRLIMVTTEPAGADIYVDGVNTQKITPAEVMLTTAQANRARVRISLRRPGYKQHDQVIEASAFRDNESQMNTSMSTKLVPAPKPTGSGSDAGSGSATPAGTGSATPDPGTGSAEPPKPPTPTPTPPPAETGSATP
jgi:hypothetical protein